MGAVLALGLCALQPGCLVQTYEYPEQDPTARITLRTPIAKGAPPQIGEITELPSAPSEDLQFTVEVGTPNVDQDLVVRLLLSTGARGTVRSTLQSGCDPETLEEPIIPANGSLQREYAFTLDRNSIQADGCYRVELAVSPEFAIDCLLVNDGLSFFAAPTAPDTSSVARWWVLVGNPPGGCPGTQSEEALR